MKKANQPNPKTPTYILTKKDKPNCRTSLFVVCPVHPFSHKCVKHLLIILFLILQFPKKCFPKLKLVLIVISSPKLDVA